MQQPQLIAEHDTVKKRKQSKTSPDKGCRSVPKSKRFKDTAHQKRRHIEDASKTCQGLKDLNRKALAAAKSRRGSGSQGLQTGEEWTENLQKVCLRPLRGYQVWLMYVKHSTSGCSTAYLSVHEIQQSVSFNVHVSVETPN